jgi:hypothetical protein
MEDIDWVEDNIVQKEKLVISYFRRLERSECSISHLRQVGDAFDATRSIRYDHSGKLILGQMLFKLKEVRESQSFVQVSECGLAERT